MREIGIERRLARVDQAAVRREGIDQRFVSREERANFRLLRIMVPDEGMPSVTKSRYTVFAFGEKLMSTSNGDCPAKRQGAGL
ncbi:hypothetical protein [Sinorhizobium psoraleae]|uniref:Uncharacterized protein n=1 Tax=Sinorhizobium psoraleae TaxID=520838 RepID=A0ABT4KKA0_9HYPH|nr:hypothetical protein [Sinorhizobium psoraleae]MCZ4092373.1 hypothetical protein [Sinorhizobium psoraleae]